LWKRRRVSVYDGSSVTMPDAPANQAAYPQPVAQKPGLGFPLARIGAMFSLACGAVVGLGLCRYAGKGQSDLGVLRTLPDLFRPGDVMLADRLMCAWTEMVMLRGRGVDCECRFTSHRKAGMLVVDQHALHERILFEQLRDRVREGKLEVQRLLIPEPIDLTMEQAGAVLEARPQLAELGLEVEDFGGGTVAVSSYPALLGRVPVAQVFRSVVDVLTTKDRPPTRDQLLDHLLATMACKAAVKAGDRLSPEEIDYLMRLRAAAEDSHHCPHGRPTSLVFSRQELDRQFKRV
jgi:hypothetical protein